MKQKVPQSIILTEICLVVFAVMLVLADVFLYPLTGWYMKARNIDSGKIRAALIIVLYVESVFGWLLIFRLGKLVRNIKHGNVFIEQNVKILRFVSYLCLGIGITAIVGGVFYQPFFFVAIAALFMTLIVRIVKNVFQQAILMKNELDYTV